jgi:cob(I)alamin adenosyltransferase
MSIVTKTGDKGETSLMYGRRVSKTDPQVEAYGSVDELTAALGLARALSENSPLADQILMVQKDLIKVMGELATAPEDFERYRKDGYEITSAEMVDRLANEISELEKDQSLYPKDWVIPGKNRVSAALDLARVTVRKAERAVIASNKSNLNRLSDWCWIMARWAEKESAGS